MTSGSDTPRAFTTTQFAGSLGTMTTHPPSWHLVGRVPVALYSCTADTFDQVPAELGRHGAFLIAAARTTAYTATASLQRRSPADRARRHDLLQAASGFAPFSPAAAAHVPESRARRRKRFLAQLAEGCRRRAARRDER